MGEFRHFLLIMWKNFKIKFHHPAIIFIDIFISCLCMILLFQFCGVSPDKSNPTETIFKPYNISYVPNQNWTFEREKIIFFSPKSIFLDQIIKEITKKLNITSLGFETEEQLVEAYLNSTSDTIITGIVFSENLMSGFNKTRKIKYKIRPESIPDISWQTNRIFLPKPAQGPQDKTSIWGTNYMTLGFLPVQHAIAMSFIKNLYANSTNNVEEMFYVQMQRFPEPPYDQYTFYYKPGFIFVVLICFVFLLPTANLAKNIVNEKEKHLKETLNIMSVAGWMNSAAWYFSSLFYFGLLCTIITVMLCVQFTKVQAIFHHSNSSLIFLCLLSYSSCLISSCFFLSTLFYSKTAAMCGAFIGFFLSLMPYMHLVLAEQKISRFVLIIFCLFPNTILGYGVGIWIKLEEMGIGLQKDNLNITGSISLQLSMKDVLFIFLGDTVFFFLLAWYIETIFPGKYIEGQPWYFPLTSLYWTGNKKPKTEAIGSFGLHELKPEYFEKEPYGVRPTIEFKHLSKTFRKGSKPALKKLFLKAYKNQITVLLGHDGSGKSTAISILLKKCNPTSGKAFIKGLNVSIGSESRKIPRFLGFCPDYDTCFDHLSVEENLYFYCKMKGFVSEGLNSQIDHILGILDLELKRKSVAGNLSLGWKRKLSVGIALIGESEIVVIDDPTGHMDSYSRRIVWEALKAEKMFRTIFVTTSFMEEADAIGDRMGIIDEGELQSFGSTSFVKNLYGAGYHLLIEKDDACKVDNVTKLIKTHVPGSKLYSSSEALKYFLPLDKAPLLQFLFNDLENKKDFLKISNYSVSQITMKELFDRVSLKASAGSYTLPEFAKEALDDFAGMGEDSLNRLFVKERNDGFALVFQQAVTILKKKFLFSIRHILLFLSQMLVFPLIFIVSNAFTADEIISDNPLLLNLELFNASGKPIEVQYSVNPSNKDSRQLSDAFASLFKGPGGTYLLDSREETLNEHLLEIGEENSLEYYKSYFLAADFDYKGNSNIITAFYHNKVLHSPSLSLFYVHNAILKYMDKDNFGHSFEVINHPLPMKNPRMILVEKANSLLTSFLIAQDFMFSISIVMAGFIVPLVLERSKQFTKLQFVSGLSRFFYWILTFLYDFSMYIMACALLLLTLYVTGLFGCSQQPQLGRVILLLLIHGIVGLLFVYCCSFFAQSSSTGYIYIFLYHMLGLVIQFSFALFEQTISRNTYENLDYLFSFFLPCYAFVQGFLNLYKNWMNNQACNNEKMLMFCAQSRNSTDYFELHCCKEKCVNRCYRWEENYFSWKSPGIGKHIVFPFVQIAIFITVIILLEHKAFSRLVLKLWYCLQIKRKFSEEGMADPQCSSSSESSLRSNECLVVRELTKYFGMKCALDNLVFSVSRGETFGLVGRKNAGKTTIVDIITGDLLMSRGQVYINGKDNTQPERKIGFCPESSALLGYLTGEETLLLFANLRGIPQPQISNCIYHLSKLLDFDHVLKQLVKDYSSCAERKLSVAISLLGTPPLIILDEPTKKMDPSTSRFVWNALLQASNVGCTILLATERMDECEAVCNRIGMLANGVLVYSGNLAELTKKYEGYTLHVELLQKSLTRAAMTSRTQSEDAKIWIEGWFPEAILKADLPNTLYYYIPHHDIKWSVFFKTMEKAKRQDKIYHYFINKTTLEEILFFVTTVGTVKERMITEYLEERMMK